MKSIKLSLAVALLATVSTVSSVSADEVEVSANVAMTSNYVWRGMTQSANSPAIQGGFDVAYGNLYAGIWGSNVNFGDKSSMEADFYFGYAGEASGLGYDVGFIQYAYPNETDGSNFGEAYIGLSYDFGAASVGATYSMGVETNDLEPTDNIEGSISIPLGESMAFDVVYGMYDEVGDYYSAALSTSYGKFDYSLAYTGISSDAGSASDEDNIVLTVGTSF